MYQRLKISTTGLTFLVVPLAVLICSFPAYAEESLNEQTEKVEEVYAFVSSKNQQPELTSEDDCIQESTQVDSPIDVRLSSTAVGRCKLFILYRSLRLYD